MWVEPDIRDEIVEYVTDISDRSSLSRRHLIRLLGIQPSRFYAWVHRVGESNRHNGNTPKRHWILPWEREAIISYYKAHPGEGYRRLTYMMLDENIVAISPSTTYRILKDAGLLNRWSPSAKGKGKGFKQPLKPHDHWHVDISYVNMVGTIYFLICVLEGASRYILHHELRTNMTTYDVEITIQRAMEKFPDVNPRIISDNGPQFISKEFKEFIRYCGFTHVRTSPYYPQSNGKLERFHGTIKGEEIRKRGYLSLADAREHIRRYVEYYNDVRLHSSLYYLTPEDVLFGRTEKRLRERQDKLDKARGYRENVRTSTVLAG
jgi:transposase InsO family protein